MNADDDQALLFKPQPAERCSLYLISPQEVGGVFPDRLRAALEPGNDLRQFGEHPAGKDGVHHRCLFGDVSEQNV